MYQFILLTLDASQADRPIIEHIKQLAGLLQSHVVLLHVATGAAAQFHAEDAAGEEVEKIRAYLETVQREFEDSGVPAEVQIRFGDAVREIIKWIDGNQCDLVAMGTHGHKLLADVILGRTATRVQHNVSVPMLLLRAP